MSQLGPKVVDEISPRPDGVSSVHPAYFQNANLIENLDSKKTLSQRKLINLWNRIHFMDETVRVRVRHPGHREDLLVEAYPLPCGGDTMTCVWAKQSFPYVEGARLLDITVLDGLMVVLIPAKFKAVQSDGFTIGIPEKAYILGKRKARHFECAGIQAMLVQDGFQAQGMLADFSSRAFTLRVTPDGFGSFRWFNADRASIINLYRNSQLVFSASCQCIRQTSDQFVREIVFAPKADHISRFLKKKWRSPRVRVKPVPNITFEHPLIRKNVQLDLESLSSSGFAVDIAADEDVLMTGMIVSDLKINFAGALKIPCKAQVLYRREKKKNRVQYGFVILDMDVAAYNRLSHIVMNFMDSGVHVADPVAADQLWEFLFDSGFIYPKKYTMIHANRRSMREIYERLYRDNPDIITQITYQWNGRIYGHASMVRSYPRTWMVHHLAARPLMNKRTGLQVLKNIMHYFNGLYRLPTVGMDYMMFYFRPENRFPDHFFGGFARHFKNPRGCSLDLFSYFNYPAYQERKPLPDGWTFEESRSVDLDALNRSYRNMSNGLLMEVLSLGKEDGQQDELSELYARHGFLRSCRSLSLKHEGRLKAVVVVNRSDVGLSLSDFLNGLKILVTDTTGLPWPVLSAAISQTADRYRMDHVPVLIYPSDYFKVQDVSVSEKKYNLWIIDAHHAREYSEYMMENIKFRIKFVIRLFMKKLKGA
jgi:hypothetical protein